MMYDNCSTNVMDLAFQYGRRMRILYGKGVTYRIWVRFSNFTIGLKFHANSLQSRQLRVQHVTWPNVDLGVRNNGILHRVKVQVPHRGLDNSAFE